MLRARLVHDAKTSFRKRVFALAFRPLVLASMGCCGTAEEVRDPDSHRPVRLFLAVGQSNMVGFGAFATSRHRSPHPAITYQYPGPDGELRPPRRTPLFFRHGSILQRYDSLRDRGVGPWWSFARRMATEDVDAEIRILMLAVNGSSLAEWMSGGLASRAVDAIGEATATCGTLEGVIWHHGESGTGSGHGDYGVMLEQLVGKFRSDLKLPRLPFVAAVLPTMSPNSSEVNAALVRLASAGPAFAVVDVPEKTLSDAVHLDTAATDKLGVAMADAMIRLLRTEHGGSDP